MVCVTFQYGFLFLPKSSSSTYWNIIWVDVVCCIYIGLLQEHHVWDAAVSTWDAAPCLPQYWPELLTHHCSHGRPWVWVQVSVVYMSLIQYACIPWRPYLRPSQSYGLFQGLEGEGNFSHAAKESSTTTTWNPALQDGAVWELGWEEEEWGLDPGAGWDGMRWEADLCESDVWIPLPIHWAWTLWDQ